MFGDRQDDAEPSPASRPPGPPDADQPPAARQVQVVSASGGSKAYAADGFHSNSQNELELRDVDGDVIAIYAPGMWRYAYRLGTQVQE